MSVARVLVVDDHPLFRQGLAGLLRELPSVELVGEAATGEEALELVAADEPDVVLMDLHMPGIGGIEATRRLTNDHPTVAVLVLTMLDDDESLRSAIAAGNLTRVVVISYYRLGRTVLSVVQEYGELSESESTAFFDDTYNALTAAYERVNGLG